MPVNYYKPIKESVDIIAKKERLEKEANELKRKNMGKITAPPRKNIIDKMKEKGVDFGILEKENRQKLKEEVKGAIDKVVGGKKRTIKVSPMHEAVHGNKRKAEPLTKEEQTKAYEQKNAGKKMQSIPPRKINVNK